MKAILTILLTAATAVVQASTSVPEPETIFYGKIINRSGPQPYQMTAGTLIWSISLEGATSLQLTAELEPLADGVYSYQLPVPHSALALDLAAGTDGIPLPATGQTHEHISISVNGFPATITEPGSYTFDVGQVKRASTYRLDLDVTFALPDTDNDGMADWWEDRYGLDKQVNDASGDLDSDGRSNLAEFLAGSDPRSDSRIPQLLTTEISASAEGISGVFLETIDDDTGHAALTYTLTTPPNGGKLALRGASPNPFQQPLGPGATFTQQDLIDGRLIFTAGENALLAMPKFSVSVSDGDPEHAPATGQVEVRLYLADLAPFAALTAEERVALALSPAPLPGIATNQDLRARKFILAKDGGYIAWNLTANSRPVQLATPMSTSDPLDSPNLNGSDSSVVIAGGTASDALEGGMSADLIIGGEGDDTLTGHGGPDRFIIAAVTDGADIITDFHTSEGDALDLSRVLKGSSPMISSYVNVVSSGADLLVNLDFNGDGSGFNDMTVLLSNAASPGTDLRSLWNGGNLLANDLTLLPRVGIATGTVHASENGPTPASFTLTLDAPAVNPVVIKLLISGSATNGGDYQLLPTQVAVPAGADSATLIVSPYVDTQTEGAEVVFMQIDSSAAYEIGATASAQITIDDLMPEITVSALVPYACKDTDTPAAFVITRTGIIDRSVLVYLQAGGTATSNSDYTPLPTYVTLSAGDTFATIPVIPLAGGTLNFGAESVRLTIKPNAAYRIGNPAACETYIVQTESRLTDWKDQNFPELDGSNATAFATGPSGSHGLANLLVYAHALDPSNPGATASQLPKVRMIDGHLAVEFTRRLGAPDIRFITEASSDLKTWRSDSAHVEDISSTLQTTDARKALFRATQPVTGENQNFLRVRVVYEP